MLNIIKEMGNGIPTMGFFSLIYFIVAYAICFFIIPEIIKKAHEKNWVDQPNHRKVHTQAIPTMGGMAIIAAALSLGLILFFSNELDWSFGAMLVGIIILTVTGIVDDLKDISAKKRLLVQFGVAFLVVKMGFVLPSLLGIMDLPIWMLEGLSIVLIVGFINAFNFIDGIDGLAGGLGLISCLVLAFFFGSSIYAYFAFVLSGALFAFLYYNFNPAKIFMGDTGSTVIGFLVVILAIKLSAFPYLKLTANPHVVAMSLLILPVFDIIRTVFFRLLKKKSPLSADKTHIHHLLIKAGNNHRKSSVALYIIHLSIIGLALYFGARTNPITALCGLFALCVLLTEILGIYKLFKMKMSLRESEFRAAEITYDNMFLEKKL